MNKIPRVFIVFTFWSAYDCRQADRMPVNKTNSLLDTPY